ncbi:uncharacterized protein E5676_scaffold522G001020 [Cucumis melo var. makuwa]|uniref:Uncharacterized protein n=1 Tax=Cucumis melo var. makuwa TaxID=1194695 RepID=A0A5D3D6I5_CUCMM|nr:uncharacterized protein E6C27_scaffold190G001530 [Cucumis melo var. makuwa]TYK19171.1 uncharacterized protein E5676_scaffold522G001020 [Cucumis melo var. makuwa]
MTEGPILGVVDATKPFKIEIERFNTNSPTRRSEFEIDGSRHSVLPPLVDHPYVGNNPQVHVFAKKWEHMVDIARACLEKSSRQWRKDGSKAMSP